MDELRLILVTFRIKSHGCCSLLKAFSSVSVVPDSSLRCYIPTVEPALLTACRTRSPACPALPLSLFVCGSLYRDSPPSLPPIRSISLSVPLSSIAAPNRDSPRFVEAQRKRERETGNYSLCQSRPKIVWEPEQNLIWGLCSYRRLIHITFK